MRRVALPVAGAALLALIAVFAVSLASPVPAPTRGEQAAALAAELRCPDCVGLSVAESSSTSAAAIRSEIGRLLDTGATPDQVRQHFVDRYGTWILLRPSAAVVWWLPVLVLLVGAASLAAWLLYGRHRQPAVVQAVADPRIEQVRREAEALDA